MMKFIAGTAFAAAFISPQHAHGTSNGYWSHESVRLAPHFGQQVTKSWSPNKKSYISEDNGGLYIKIGNRKRYFNGASFSPNSVEVLWSPDSQFVAITGSDGGAVGTWSVLLVDTRGNDISEKLNTLIQKYLKDFAKCQDREAVNVGAHQWSPRGDILISYVEVPPHSNCRNMGDVKEISIAVKDWKVLKIRGVTRSR